MYNSQPFNPKFLPVWKVIKSACEVSGIEPCRVDLLPLVDDINKAIFDEIERSELIIVDFTGDKDTSVPNPNVVTEAKHAKDKKKTMLILTQSTEALPFDWRMHRATIYTNDKEGMEYLKEVLTENLKGIKNRLLSKNAEEYFQRAYNHYITNNYNQAWHEIELACSLIQDPRYLMLKARMLYHGQGVKEDEDLACKLAKEQYNKLLQNSDSFRLCSLGWIYEFGVGVPEDYNEAMKWYRMAADKGDADAMCSIGRLYENGEVVNQDYEEALKWYRRAADEGNAEAMWRIGVMYELGEEASQDYDEAMRWYRKAADKGDVDAMCSIGSLYENGEGVNQDYDEAMRWYRMAADKGDADAMVSIGNFSTWKMFKSISDAL